MTAINWSATVHECDLSVKPCRVASTGAAYLRGYDGDFELSDLETDGFLAARRPPHFDRAPVDGATREDLDRELISLFVTSVQSGILEGLVASWMTRNPARSGAVLPDGRVASLGS